MRRVQGLDRPGGIAAVKPHGAEAVGASQPVKGGPEALPDVPIGKEVRLSAKGCEPDARLIIHSKAGDRAIAADPQGAFVITWDPDLYREDPWVSFPQAARSRPAQP